MKVENIVQKKRRAEKTLADEEKAKKKLLRDRDPTKLRFRDQLLLADANLKLDQQRHILSYSNWYLDNANFNERYRHSATTLDLVQQIANITI